MKYKHINSAIHNFGHSFTSLMNYVDDGYVIDELVDIHAKGYDIEVNWLTGTFKPEVLRSPRIKKSIGYWRDNLSKHLTKHGVGPEALTELLFVWPARERKQMRAVDNRGKSYRMYVNEIK
ncbi:hypothetical protein GCM10011487_15670 [Steroidobacter agaridevorans]|uniref:Uncharacterized protein n=1 Tax=Steroidobacter agaridevorans TaxID=2695856 RepID=A0A829Y8E8_9GAMM|nr:hypothetical protein [Steroidobacter agaridevorans]GFE79567.1 hypothetical protein GCM10011487_15670 [Steroidobacter agaridevorans]GFE88572.1 hypothetical protein GCM10011488_35260 [Steroidobacter agaridevorans]